MAAQTVCAQTIRLSGKVTDKRGKAIDLATIVLKDSTEKILTGGICDSTGSFIFEFVPPKVFDVHISCVGYDEYFRHFEGCTKDVFISASLDSSAVNLGEVVVTSKTPFIRREIDRVVLNAEKLNVVASNFMDVLNHTPGIIVQDDAISMLGKGKVIILMNGRELKMDMRELYSYLSSLPSDNLKQIEIMTTPPSKYSAEGNAGIINLVTKRIKNNYIGGNVSERLSVKKEYLYDDIGLNLQYKCNKIEAYTNIGCGLGTMQYENKYYIHYPLETWNTTNCKLKSNDYILAMAGIDYMLTKKASIGAIMSYSYMRPYADEQSETFVLSSVNDRLKHFETFTDFQCDYNRYNANLHCTIDSVGNVGTLNVNADYLNYTIDDCVNLQTTHDETLSYLNRPNTSIRIFQCKADMEKTIGNNAILSYGIAYSQSKTNNRTCYERISNNYDLNDHFIYSEDIIASYADLRYKLSNKWEAKLGIRGEYGKLDGNSIKLDKHSIKYQFDLFPTAFISYNLDVDNTLSWSFSSRINRPSYVDINPFTTYIDAHTIQTGNPNLLPEKTYSSEFGYTMGNLSLSASVTLRNRVISSYTSIDPIRKITTLTVDNVMKKQMYSIDISYYFDKISWFSSSIDGSLYTIASKAESGYNLEKIHQTSAYFYINNNFYLNRNKTFVANLWGQYQTKEKDVVGESPERYRIDLGIKYFLFGKKLSIGLDCQNMLASHSKSIVKTGDATYIYDKMPYRVLNISLSYRFGKKHNITPKKFEINSDRL